MTASAPDLPKAQQEVRYARPETCLSTSSLLVFEYDAESKDFHYFIKGNQGPQFIAGLQPEVMVVLKAEIVSISDLPFRQKSGNFSMDED